MRIKDVRWMKASDLRANPENWRRHPYSQRKALQSLLDEVGFADVLLAYEKDGEMTLVDGHLRADVVGDDLVPVGILDVNDNEAKKILATHDPLSAMAETDAAQLAAILDEIAIDDEALNKLLSELSTVDDIPLAPGHLIEPDSQFDNEVITAVLNCPSDSWSEFAPALFGLQENHDVKINVS